MTKPVPSPSKPLPAVFAVSIKGLQDDKYAIDMVATTAAVPEMFPEFVGNIHVAGDVRKFGKRYIVTATATCDAQLCCDVSGEEFTERIETPLVLEYMADTRLFLEKLRKNDDDPEPPYYIREDDTTIDLTDTIRQELAVALPLKRVAPAYRGTSFAELFPEHAAEATAGAALQTAENVENGTENGTSEQPTEPIDPRWAALKAISFTGN